MLTIKDQMFLIISVASLITGILLPSFAILFSYSGIMLMITLYLSMLKLDFKAIGAILHHPFEILYLSVLKLIVLPVAAYYIMSYVYPSLAVAALLLSGVAVGSFAPFMSNLLGARTPIVVCLVIVTCLLMPFTLPFLVHYFAGKTLVLSVSAMTKTLASIVIIPLILAYITNHFAGHIAKRLHHITYPITMGLFYLIISATFAEYHHVITTQPKMLLILLVTASALSFGYLFIGYYALWYEKRRDVRITGAVSLVWINAILVVVFSGKYFGPPEAGLALLYLIPYEFMLVPARKMMDGIKQRRQKRS